MRLKNGSMVTAGAALAAGVALVIAGCTAPAPEPSESATPTTTAPPTRATSATTPTADPELAAATEAILEAYDGYWNTKVAILADPSAEPGTALETYAVDTALTDVYSTVLTYRSNRIVMVGGPVLHPEVSDVVPGPGGTATITDCVDVADWQPVFRESGDSAAAPGQAIQVLTISGAYFYDGRWTIRSSTVDRDTPC